MNSSPGDDAHDYLELPFDATSLTSCKLHKPLHTEVCAKSADAAKLLLTRNYSRNPEYREDSSTLISSRVTAVSRCSVLEAMLPSYPTATSSGHTVFESGFLANEKPLASTLVEAVLIDADEASDILSSLLTTQFRIIHPVILQKDFGILHNPN